MPRFYSCGKTVTPSKHLSSGEPDDAKVSSPVRRGVCGKVSARITRHFPTLLNCIPWGYSLLPADQAGFDSWAISSPLRRQTAQTTVRVCLSRERARKERILARVFVLEYPLIGFPNGIEPICGRTKQLCRLDYFAQRRWHRPGGSNPRVYGRA